MSINKKNNVQTFGIILMVIGFLGFISNPIFGIFRVDNSQNIIHLLTGGLAFYIAVYASIYTSLYGKFFGILYAIITLLGFLLPAAEGMILGVISVNIATNFLHVVITLFLLYIALAPSAETKKNQ